MRTFRTVLFASGFSVLAMMLAGCGPGLLALAGGTGGGILGFGGKKEKDGGGSGGGTNTPPVVVVTSLTREDAPATIAYTLIDAESNLCSVSVRYSRDGTNFFPCTQGAGGDGTTGLNSSSGGTAHTFEWDYQIDLLTQGLVQNITIAITPTDGATAGVPGTLTNQSAGNDAPELIVSTSPASPGVLVSGSLVLVTFFIQDTSSDIAGMVVAYSLDQGQTFTELTGADYVGTPPIALLTTTTGTPGQFIWDSSVQLPAFVGSNVYLGLIPVDRPNGWADFTIGDAVPVGPLSLNNVANGPPEIELVSDVNGTSQVGRVNLQFTLTDAGSDSATVDIEYSVNGGAFLPARLVGQSTPQAAGPFVCTPNPRLYSVTWDGLADMQTSGPQLVELRLTPSQLGASPAVSGTPVLTGQFDFAPNEAPAITEFEVFQNSGNVTVRLRVQDSTSDNVDCAITVFWNGSLNSAVLTGADFLIGDPTDLLSSVGGEDNVLVWDSSLAMNLVNAADVRWEITPTDIPASHLPAAITGATFVSGNFPIINDPAGAVPIGINLTETGGAVTVQLSGTRNFSATILPAAAADHRVNWDIVEGAGNGTITPVSSPLQGPQTATFTAPGVLPAPNPGFCTIRATSQVAPAVVATYRLYWGQAPTSVSVTPPTANVVLGQPQIFTAAVSPGGAPQLVTWTVIGGAANGSVDNAGRYIAPATMPASNTVTIRATSVSTPVFGEATVTLKPLPNSILVTTGASFPGPSQVALFANIQFTATIDPPDAPQQVFWTIDWNGSSQGSGNATVGNIGATGQYFAPTTLPTPSQIYVRARSQVAGAVTDDYLVELIAPAPTSFQVSPSTANVTAGGAGVDFNITSLIPSFANPSVNWTISPAFGGIDGAGFYTPPPNSSTTTIVTVTATSTVAGSVFANATVTVAPNTMAVPTGVTVTPTDARTFVSGRQLQFAASVQPGGASQSVSWSVVSGAGTITGAGVYTPPSTGQFDGQAVVRATSTVITSLWDEVTVDVDGLGNLSISTTDLAMGRNDPYGCYDAGGENMFFMGGQSEATVNLSPAKHDDLGFRYNLSSDIWTALSRFSPAETTNSISCCYDETRKLLYAFVGNSTNPIGVYRLNVTSASPTWSVVSGISGSTSDRPILSGSARALCMFSATDDEIWIFLGTTLFRLDVAASPPDWQSRKTNVTGTLATPDAGKCTYFYDTVSSKHTVIGSAVVATVASTKVWTLNESTWKWAEVVTTGPGPAVGLDDASSIFHNTAAWVFGGRDPGGIYKDAAYWLDTSSTPYVWSTFALTGLRKPQSRGRAALVNVGSDVFLFGGKNLVGMFGDVWKIDLFTGACTQPSPEGIRPQGRKAPAATWVDGEGAGYVYGGICDYGVSDELWRLEYSTGKSMLEWFLVDTNPTSATSPPQLQGASLVYDTANSRLLLFGGNKASSGTALLQNATYSFNSGTSVWSLLTPSGTLPVARMNHSACFDSINSRMVIFGGQDSNATTPFRNDVQFLNVASPSGNWVQATIVAGSIDGRTGAFCGITATGDRMVVLGGYTLASGATLQLYELEFISPSLGTWTAIPTFAPTTPKSIVAGAGAWDPAGERFLNAPSGLTENQALVNCHQVVGVNPQVTWQILQNGAVIHGIGATGMYDPSEKRFYAFGGDIDLGGSKFRKINQVRSVRFK